MADEILQKVRQLDGLARFRFATDAEAFAGWRSASNKFGPARASGGEAATRGSKDVPPAAPPRGGEIKPAA